MGSNFCGSTRRQKIITALDARLANRLVPLPRTIYAGCMVIRYQSGAWSFTSADEPVSHSADPHPD